ncbi:hypothetical protein AKJ43_02260 [candidate division MSBL1 archaeon SCGC-AAA261D19]|uniref:Uncharacterized protein n=1 Tax=candidate division MSBL1 archaeon SCGC-AAA261D19 TaxID=1698273 RepID=A0A133V6Z3_9EURY|nr:hypothetical protein AKJ43_02260 [candidate division MSBL1 archaeon SCGC-AAA261D19]
MRRTRLTRCGGEIGTLFRKAFPKICEMWQSIRKGVKMGDEEKEIKTSKGKFKAFMKTVRDELEKSDEG